MTKLAHLKEKFANRSLADVVGISCSGADIRVVRLRRAGAGFQIAGAEKFSSTELSGPLPLGPKLRARYAGLCRPSVADAIKLLRVGENFDSGNEDELASRLALSTSVPCRIKRRVLLPGAAKTESRILVAAMTEEQSAALVRLIPATGMPAARALELSEIAILNAFYNDPRMIEIQSAYGLVHFDDEFSLVALFNNKLLSQLRIFPFGVSAVLHKVMNALNVDQPTAEAVLMDGAFDISHLIEEGFRDIRSQLVISRDFMERSENCSLDQLYISGPVSLTRPFAEGISGPQTVEEWNVLEPYPEAVSGAVPGDFAAEPWRLVASIGVCLGLLLPT